MFSKNKYTGGNKIKKLIPFQFSIALLGNDEHYSLVKANDIGDKTGRDRIFGPLHKGLTLILQSSSYPPHSSAATALHQNYSSEG